MRRLRPYRLLQALLLSMLICLIGGGIALFSQAESGQRSHAQQAADPASVVGQPTLPAATVDAIFARMGSPMYGTGKVVEQAARQANIDDAFALGVWWTETNDGAAGVGSADRNPGSVRGSAGFPAAFDGYTIYPSYAAAISDWFNLLRSRYVNRGLTTVYAISYPYVGTSSSPLWAGKVVALMQRYRAEAPPLPPPLDSVANGQHTSHLTVPASILLRNHPHPRTIGGGTVNLRSQNQEVPVPANVPQRASTPALSQGTEYSVVFLGLLAALVLALYGLTLDGKLPLPLPLLVRTSAAGVAANPRSHVVAQVPSTSARAVPVTAALVATPQPQPVLATGFAAFYELLPQRQTDALVPLPLSLLRPSPSIAPRVGLPVRSQEREQESEKAASREMSPATGPLTTGLRRVVLLPSQSQRPSHSMPAPVPVSAHSSVSAAPASSIGLLSRYREMQQREASSV